MRNKCYIPRVGNKFAEISGKSDTDAGIMPIEYAFPLNVPKNDELYRRASFDYIVQLNWRVRVWLVSAWKVAMI